MQIRPIIIELSSVASMQKNDSVATRQASPFPKAFELLIAIILYFQKGDGKISDYLFGF